MMIRLGAVRDAESREAEMRSFGARESRASLRAGFAHGASRIDNWQLFKQIEGVIT
jgi:hypothetical protein